MNDGKDIDGNCQKTDENCGEGASVDCEGIVEIVLAWLVFNAIYSAYESEGVV